MAGTEFGSAGARSRLRISAEELRMGAAVDLTIDNAARLFDEFGFIWLERVMEPVTIARCREAFETHHAVPEGPWTEGTANRVGDRRYMITIPIADPFSNPSVYANSFVLPVLTRLLGTDLILNSLGIVYSLPGAQPQSLHRDHPWLFESSAVSAHLPPYAITLVVPLINLDMAVGPTAVWEGSHKLEGWRPRNHQLPSLPTARVGDAYLMDYRLLHAGSPNNSSCIRPILYLVYSRPWFRDAANFSRVPPLLLNAKDLAKIPEPHAALFRHAALHSERVP